MLLQRGSSCGGPGCWSHPPGLPPYNNFAWAWNAPLTRPGIAIFPTLGAWSTAVSASRLKQTLSPRDISGEEETPTTSKLGLRLDIPTHQKTPLYYM